MGDGRSTNSAYAAVDADARTKGQKAFQYTTRAQTEQLGIHRLFMPLNGIRESAAEGAADLAVVIDQTGSNRQVPIIVREKLSQLISVLTQGHYVKQPAIQFYFMGDSRSDRHPHQRSQIESRIEELDEILTNAILEGNGGGQRREDYGEAAWALYNLNNLHVWRRGGKGVVVFIGDEMPYERTEAHRLRTLFGAHVPLSEGDLTREEIFSELQNFYDVYLIRCQDTQYYHDSEIEGVWRNLIGGEHILHLPDANDICPMLAGIMGYRSGVSLDRITHDLGDTVTTTLMAISDAKGIVPSVRRFR